MPWADGINHCSSAGERSVLQYDEAHDAAVLFAHRTYAAGEEVFDSYGTRLTPADLLLDYGFVDPKNKFAAITVRLSRPVPAFKAVGSDAGAAFTWREARWQASMSVHTAMCAFHATQLLNHACAALQVPAASLIEGAEPAGLNSSLLTGVSQTFSGAPEMRLTDTGIDDTLLSYVRCAVASEEQLRKAGWAGEWQRGQGLDDVPLDVMARLVQPDDINTEARVRVLCPFYMGFVFFAGVSRVQRETHAEAQRARERSSAPRGGVMLRHARSVLTGRSGVAAGARDAADVGGRPAQALPDRHPERPRRAAGRQDALAARAGAPSADCGEGGDPRDADCVARPHAAAQGGVPSGHAVQLGATRQSARGSVLQAVRRQRCFGEDERWVGRACVELLGAMLRRF